MGLAETNDDLYKINNKVLLCSTVNYIQYLVISYNGRKSEKEYIYIYNFQQKFQLKSFKKNFNKNFKFAYISKIKYILERSNYDRNNERK